MNFCKHSTVFSFLVPVFLGLLAVPALTQTSGETIFQSYERVFIRSSLSTKVNVLADAVNDEAADEFYGPLCEAALRFVTENAPLFRDDPDMVSIAVTAVKGIGNYAYNPAVGILWQVFLQFPDNVIRYEILNTLAVLDSSAVMENINEFLAEQNRRYGSGLGADFQMLEALFTLLGRIGDDSSYPVLFASSLIYSGELEALAVRSLYSIDGDFYAFCHRVIIHNPPAEKLEAFKLGMAREGTAGERGVLAEVALEAALIVPGDRRLEIRELSEQSLDVIRETEWVRALPQVLKYYTQSLAAFRADHSRKEPLLNAVVCLGVMKSAEAAQTLALQLGLYNSRPGALRAEELEVVLALINALGQLGYRASYDALHHAGALPYPDEITEAARKALAALQW